MCLTIPAKITGVAPDGRRVTIEDASGQKELETPLTPGLSVGDWVLYINRLVIRKIEPDDAREILELLQGGKDVDRSRLSRSFLRAVETLHTGRYKTGDIVRLLAAEGEEKEALLREADTVRRARLRDFICIHGIIEFSNHCEKDCLYCGLRAANASVERFRMEPDEIVETAIEAVNKKGYKLLVLQSGEDPAYDAAVMADIVRRIKQASRVFIFISPGERGYEYYKSLKEAGASGALLRFETANERLFNELHPAAKTFKGHFERLGPAKTFKGRFEHLRFMKELGYYIATGSLTGLPGQTLEDVAVDIMETRKWAGMVSTGPFVSSPDTPLAGSPAGDPELQLKVCAVLRLVMQSSRIPVVTALETLCGDEGRRRALRSGANSLMINLTPERYRRLYGIYPDRFHDADSVFERYGLYRYEESFAMLEERMMEEIS